MDHVWYEQLPDGMHDVLVGPQGGLFLAGFDSLRQALYPGAHSRGTCWTLKTLPDYSTKW